MPFTLAHPIAVVPLRRMGLGLEALAIGAMVPDLVLFARLPVGYALTHSPIGILTVDLVLGVLLLMIWTVLLRAPLTDAMPLWARERLPAPPPMRMPGPMPVLAAAAGVVIGAITHVLWDSFTHGYGVFVGMIPALRAMIGPLPVHAWLQHASGALGLLGLAVLSALALRRAQPRPIPRRCPRLAPLVLLVPCVVGALTAGVVAGALWGRTSAEVLAYVAVTRSITAAALMLMVCAAGWWVAPLLRPARS